MKFDFDLWLENSGIYDSGEKCESCSSDCGTCQTGVREDDLLGYLNNLFNSGGELLNSLNDFFKQKQKEEDT